MKHGLRLLSMTLFWMLLASGCALAFDPIPYAMAPAPYAPHEECYLPDNAGYHDDSLDIRVESFRRYDTTVMAVYVTIADASQLRTGTPLARQTPGASSTSVPWCLKKHRWRLLL